jgi:hypothetical protein
MFALAMAKDKIVWSLRQMREEWNDPAKKAEAEEKAAALQTKVNEKASALLRKVGVRTDKD